MGLSIEISAQDNTQQAFSDILANMHNLAKQSEESADEMGLAIEKAFRQAVASTYESGSSLQEALASQFSEIVRNSGEMGEGIMRNIGASFNNGFDLTVAKNNLEAVGQKLDELRAELKSLPQAIEAVEGKIAELSAKRAELNEVIASKQAEGADPFDVAKYENSVKKVDEQISRLETELANLREGQQATSEVFDNASAAYYVLSGAIDAADTSTQSLRAKLTEVTNEMQRLAEAGKTDTERFKQLAAQAAELKTSISETGKAIAYASKQGAALTSVISGLQMLSGAYSTALGAVSLFNDDIEANAEVQKNLQAVIATTTGLQSVYNSVLKTSSLMQGIFAIQSKATAAAKALETKATVGATIAQKAFNIVAKANPYVLLASALITVVGALAAFAIGSSRAKKQSEAFKKSVEEQNAAIDALAKTCDTQLKIDRAMGQSEEFLAKRRIDYAEAAVEKSLAIENEIRADLRSNDIKKKQKKVLEELLVAQQKVTAQLKEAVTDTRNDAMIARMARTKQAAEELVKIQKDVSTESVRILMRETDNRKKQIDLQTKIAIAGIEEQRAAYKKKYGNEADPKADAAFNEQVRQVRIKAKLDKTEVDKEVDNMIDDLQKEVADLSKQNQVNLMGEVAKQSNDPQKKLDYLKAEHDLRIQNIEATNNQLEAEKLAEAAKSSKGGEEGEEYAERAAKITTEIANKQSIEEQQADAEYAQKRKDTLDEMIQAYVQYAERVVEIENEKNEKLRQLEESDMSEEDKATLSKSYNDEANFEKDQAAYDILGVAANEIPTEIMGVVDNIMGYSLEKLQENMPGLLQELKDLKSQGLDSKQQWDNLIKASVGLKVASSQVKSKQKEVGASSAESAELMQKKFTKAQKSLGKVVEATRSIGEAFDEYLSDGAKEALQTMETVAMGAIAMIDGIKLLANASAEEIKAVESASVILAVIAAAIQVTMAIVNAMMSKFSKQAKLQAAIDENKEKIEDLERAEKKLEFQQKRTTGRDYWKKQAEEIANARQQAELYEENIHLAEEKKRNAKTKKKADKAQDEIDEATEGYYSAMDEALEKEQEMLEFMTGTTLESFASDLAESIVEGFAEGLDLKTVWDDAFRELMKAMLQSQITMDLQERLKPFFENTLGKITADNNVTEQELKELERAGSEIRNGIEERMAMWQQIYENMGLNEVSDKDNASSGGFESMSQDTADELNARFTALQMEGANIQMLAEGMSLSVSDIQRMMIVVMSSSERLVMDVNLGVQIAQDQLNQLEMIQANTSLLEETNRRLRAVEMNTERL